MGSVECYRPWDDAEVFVPGDFLLAPRRNLIAGVISLAQKRRFRGPDSIYAHWTHSAMIVGPDGALVEAEVTGVRQRPIARYHSNEYHLGRLGPEFSAEGRARAVAYSRAHIGQGFGFLDMFGASLYLLFRWPLRLVR